MITDDERREVARRLRGQAKMLGPNMDAPEFAHYTADVIDVNECMTWYEMELRLADLIEPPLQCPYYRSDRHRCSIHDVPAIDRDALIELAEGLECKADDIIRAAKHAQFSGFGPSMGEAEHDAYEWRCIAHRIREALGVES